MRRIDFFTVWANDCPHLTSNTIEPDVAAKLGFDDFDPDEGKTQWYIERPEDERLERFLKILREQWDIDPVVHEYDEKKSEDLGWEAWDGYEFGFKDNPEMERIANDLIENDHDHAHLAPARFKYVFKRGKPAKEDNGQYVWAYVQMMPKMTKSMGKWDFLMVTYEDVWNLLNDEQKRRLVDHELFHAGYKSSPYMIDHDIQDFRRMFSKYGVPVGEDIYSNANCLIDAFYEQKEEMKREEKEAKQKDREEKKKSEKFRPEDYE